jgi:nicotinamidase-related amidase
MRIDKGSSMVLVVDIQDKLFPHMENRDEMVQKAITLLQGMTALGVPIMAARQYPQGLGDTIEQLRPFVSEYNDKTTFSCCGDVDLLAKLRGAGKKHIIIIGIEAHICVLQTVVDLMALGFLPVVVTDAIGSRNRHDYQIALKRMEYEGAMLTTVESILFELCRAAGSEVFKTISRLVK